MLFIINGVIITIEFLDGALPRKTFSMGHSYDKRYYLEARGCSIIK